MDKYLIAKRIREERERCKLSQTDVAKYMGWDSSGHTIVGQVESGDRDLKAWELYKLANLFHIEVEQLFAASVPSETLVLWRNKPKEAVATLKERQFLQRCEDYKFLEDLLGEALPIKHSLPTYEINLDTANEDWANDLADTVHKQLNLGDFPSTVLPKILEENYGIRFLSLPLTTGAAACSVYSFGPAILLNENEPSKQAFRIAHELFHIITWNQALIHRITSDRMIEHKVENLAEVFAGALLMPAPLLSYQLRQMIALRVLRYSTIIVLASEYKVSPSALLHRMRYLGIITKGLLETILDDKRFQVLEQQNNTLPDNAIATLGERFTKLACQAYQQFNKISRSRLAKLLGVSLPSIGNILTAHGFTETDDEEIQISHT